jgi:hypothetical protein
MFLRIFGLFALAFALSGTQSWACTPASESNFCTDSFNAGATSDTFDFSRSGDGVITFQFETVLTPFDLTVTANRVTSITNLDPAEFPTSPPPGTVCIPYSSTSCVRYDVTGSAGGPNGVPVRGVDYRGLITVTLNYNSFYTPHIPAFGHAPGDNATDIFSENILTSYVDPNAPCPGPTNCPDPGMGGKTPGLSSFAALDIPFAQPPGDIVCSLTAVRQNTTSGQNPIVEVSFKIVSGSGSCSSSTPLRDKTATLSVGIIDSNGRAVAVSLVNGGDSNKFHFDNTNGLNVQDVNTNGLPPGSYFVTVISKLFSPVTAFFTLP